MRIYRIASIASVPPLLLKAIMAEIDLFNMSNEMDKHINVPVDLTGWRYGGNELLDKFEKKDLELRSKIAESFSKLPIEQLPDMVKDYLGRDKQEAAHFHAWYLSVNLHKRETDRVHRENPAVFMITLGILECLTTGDRSVVQKNLEHELIHYGQYLMANIFGPGGASSISETIRRMNLFGPRKKARDPHKVYDHRQTYEDYNLSDEEYQTILHDIEWKLKQLVDKWPPERRRWMFDSFVRNNRQLNIIKRNPRKYRDMITELSRLI